MIKDTKDIKIVTAALSVAEYESFANPLCYVDLFFDNNTLQNEDTYIKKLAEIISKEADELCLLIRRLYSEREDYIKQIKEGISDIDTIKSLALVTVALITILDVFVPYKNKQEIPEVFLYSKF